MKKLFTRFVGWLTRRKWYEDLGSSAIDAIGYRWFNHTLVVEFAAGQVYVYYDVPRFVVKDFLRATSKGRFFNEFIKDQYAFRVVDAVR